MEYTQQKAYLRLEELLPGISDAFVCIDQSWHYRFANDKALLLMNKKRSDLIGKIIWNIFPDIGTVFEENYRKVMEERMPVAFDAYHPSHKWLEVRAYPHNDGIAVFFSDITEQKKAHEIIEESEKWFHNIADNSPVMVWSASPDMFYNYVNNTWLAFTGHKPAQVLGNGWIGDIFQDDEKRVMEICNDAVEREIDFRTEYRMRYRDGSYRWVTHAGKPLYAPDKTLLGYTGTCIDVDEQVMIYQGMEQKVSERTVELSDALDREKEMNHLKSRFVSIASHEFRTPLSTMLSSVGLMEQYHAMNKTEQMVKHMERIKTSIRHMINILNEFLSLDKLEQGEVKVDLQALDLEQFLREIVEELSPLLKADQEVLCNYRGTRQIITDKKIIHNVLTNLLSNAIKYSEADIKVQISVDDVHTDITVTDQGIGIPEEDQQRMFHKYFRASNVGSVKGTGLGLNIVQRYVELLNGNITFVSIPGKGTTFKVQLPHMQDVSSEMPVFKTV